jgi:hypothetical protein
VWALRVPRAEVGPLLALATPALALGLATGLWSGAAFGDPAWRSARGMLTASGRIASSVLLLVQAAGWLALTTWLGTRPAQAHAALWLPAAVAVLPCLALLSDTARRLERPAR